MNVIQLQVSTICENNAIYRQSQGANKTAEESSSQKDFVDSDDIQMEWW